MFGDNFGDCHTRRGALHPLATYFGHCVVALICRVEEQSVLLFFLMMNPRHVVVLYPPRRGSDLTATP